MPLSASRSESPTGLESAAALVRRIVLSRSYPIPREERADLVQEAMVQLWRALSGPASPEIRNLDGLAATIAHRCCLAWMRRRRRLEELPADLPERGPSAEEGLMNEERRALGLRVLRQMPEGCRLILRLHVFEKLTYREIAQRLDRSEHGLRTQMFECLREARRAIDRLRREPGVPAPGRQPE